jgi:hypothetical protein
MPPLGPPSPLKSSTAPSTLTSTSLTVLISGTLTEPTRVGAPAPSSDQM